MAGGSKPCAPTATLQAYLVGVDENEVALDDHWQLVAGHATAPPERGVFLPITWRMCPDVCRFISEAVYDGRLFPEELNAHQRLVLGTKPHPALRPTGTTPCR